MQSLKGSRIARDPALSQWSNTDKDAETEVVPSLSIPSV